MAFISSLGEETPGEITAEDWQEFEAWLQVGIERKWVSRPHCATHDGVVGTEDEEREWEEGSDPCQTIVRVWNV